MRSWVVLNRTVFGCVRKGKVALCVGRCGLDVVWLVGGSCGRMARRLGKGCGAVVLGVGCLVGAGGLLVCLRSVGVVRAVSS